MKVICTKELDNGRKMLIDIGTIYDVVQMVKDPIPGISDTVGVYYELLQIPKMWYHERCFSEISSNLDELELVNEKEEVV